MRATPFCMDTRSPRYDLDASFAHGHRHTIMPRDLYKERQTIEVDATDPHDACEALWMRFQNIDEDRLTPDGGRSLMTGDLARIEHDGRTTWFVCCSVGWSETKAPGDDTQRIGSRIAAGDEHADD